MIQIGVVRIIVIIIHEGRAVADCCEIRVHLLDRSLQCIGFRLGDWGLRIVGLIRRFRLWGLSIVSLIRSIRTIVTIICC